jgi:HNH endonuclease
MACPARPIEVRFWPKVSPEPNTGCWLWAGAVNSAGYGKIGLPGDKTEDAHRVSWRLTRGDPGAMSVLHKCDVPACVNPAHLFLGTQADNMQDMIAKGRRTRSGCKGEDQPNAKLTESSVRSIRARYLAGEPAKKLAAEFGIVPDYVSQLARRKAWRHI